jgi:hypothetical protein
MLCVHWSPQPAHDLDSRTLTSSLCCLQEATLIHCCTAHLANPGLLP